MRIISLALLFGSALSAQSLGFYVDTSNGALPTSQLTPLSSLYQFANTPAGGSSTVIIRVANTSASSVLLNNVFVGASPNSTVSTPNFAITGLDVNATLAPQAWKLFTLSFTPASTGTAVGYLQAQAAGAVSSVATLQGTGAAPVLTLTCTNVSAPGTVTQCNGSGLQPNTTTPINFGNVSTTATAAIQFTLTNSGTATLNLQTVVSLAVQTNNPNSAFQLSSLPASLAAGASTNFTVTFAPGSASLSQTTLAVGTNSYVLQGTGVSSVIGDISSLAITYVDSTGVRLTPQAATPIAFAQIVAATGASQTLTFTVANPQTTISAVSVAALTVSGAAFTIANAPTIPATIQPGQSITFQVVFSAASVGVYSGTLAIGTRQFSLSGQTILGLISGGTLSVDSQPLKSQQQAHLSVQVATVPAADVIGTLAMTFTSSVTGITNDPAINFVATSGRSLQITIPAGSQTGMYNNQPAITFQTGTTAGTIAFTLTFPNSAPISQSFTIAPDQVEITSSTAVRQSPNLVLTLTGYDNTYSAGQLSFTFRDTSGNVLTPSAIQVNASSAFNQYFFGSSNKAGGAFSLQATFPVTGDATQVGSVVANLTNSVGQASVTQTFQ